MIVAIDGPAGAGKSTVARRLAERLGAGYLDTGAMYRALTWLALADGVAPGDGIALARLARRHPVRIEPRPEGDRVWVVGRDVTGEIRTPRVTREVSEVSAHAEVREEVVRSQRALLAEGDWVADGRDVGSAVAPDAAVKVFLTATPRERARRRREDLARAGVHVDEGEVLADVERRDRLDRERAASPLRVAEGAVVVDSSERDSEDVVDLVAEMVSAWRAGAGRPA